MMQGDEQEEISPPPALKVRPRRAPRVPLAAKKIGADLNLKIEQLYELSRGGGCRNMEDFIEKIIYYGCQRYEFQVLPVEIPGISDRNKDSRVITTPSRSGKIIFYSDRLISRFK